MKKEALEALRIAKEEDCENQLRDEALVLRVCPECGKKLFDVMEYRGIFRDAIERLICGEHGVMRKRYIGEGP